MMWVATEERRIFWPTASRTTSARRHHVTVAAAPIVVTNGTTVSQAGATGSIPASVPM